MAQLYARASDLDSTAYVILGLATCYLQEDGELTEIETIEPVPSAAFEAIVRGVPTAYKRLTAFTLGSLLPDSTPDSTPDGTPDRAPDAPQKPVGFETGEWSADFSDRLIATARTYKRQPAAAARLAIGNSWDGANYSLDRKRILNPRRRVKLTDNVKQHAHTHKIL